ncbi:MAG: hypothetical protein ACHBN1_27570 [Heteroscytonema crispum UTEX LB 1556]
MEIPFECWGTTNDPSGEPVLGGKPDRSTPSPPTPEGFTRAGTRETRPQRPFTTNHAIALHQSPGSGKRHCDPWPDPKTAVAPLPRARSSPEGIFPTADASVPSPTTN